MRHPVLQGYLQALSRAQADEEKRRLFQRYRRELLRHPEIGAELVAVIAHARDGDEVADALEVLEMLIGEARMDRENGGAYGPAFLSALEHAIEGSAGNGAITEAGSLLLARGYVRGGLEVPQRLRRSVPASERGPSTAGEDPDLDALLDRLTEEVEGNAYALHAALSELLATVDTRLQGMMIGAMMERDSPTFQRLGCYWLLDSAEDVRRAAAEAFGRRARAGRLDATMTARLMELRDWLPDDGARAKLDQVLTAARARDLAGGGTAPRPWTLHRLLATLPDGAGAQSMAIAAQRGGERGVAMLLLKQGFGVKDAYVIPCESATEQRRLMARIAEESGAQDVTPEILAPALTGALAEGQAIGAPAAHGLLDVVEVVGLDSVRPEAMAVEDWITHLDPEGELSRLSPQKFGRLVNASADWPDHYPLVESWYEDSAAVQEILTEATTPRSREGLLWRHLETRRDWWAPLLAKAAATLKATTSDPGEEWKSFAATALALARGRPLRKVPIMSWIVVRSLEAAGAPWGLAQDEEDVAGSSPEAAERPVHFTPPAPEKKGELARLMKKVGMEVTPDWIDGYLAAIIVAPKVLQPSAWVSGLLDQQQSFADHDELQRFLDLVLLRYNAANTDLADAAAAAARIRAVDAHGLRQWTQGFTESVARHKGHWRSASVSDDDKRVLKLIAEGAKGRAGASELKPLLCAWLARRHIERR